MESFISEWGLAAVFLFGFLEAACVPIPSEITFGFAGVLAYQGHFNIVLVILIGTIAELIGSFLSYYVGRIGGRPLVERFGRYLLISSADLDRAERFFVGRGAFAVPLGRALPIVRTFISLVAGFVEMPAGLFGVLSLAGTAVWVTVISLVGYGLGSAWQSIAHGIALAGYVIAVVVVLAIVAFIAHRVRELRKESAARLDSPPRPGAPGGLGRGAVPGSGAVRDDAARRPPGHRKVRGPST
jgi:membrane protein DedA with SNARE-associated domain